MWVLFYLTNIAPKFFSLDFSSFSRNNVCKTLSFPSGIFWSLSLNDKQKKHYFDEQQTGRSVYSVLHRNLAVCESKQHIEAEIWQQIVYMGYCDVNTTRESIERQTKYHRTN